MTGNFIFYREEKKICFKKDKIEYIVCAHHMKNDRSILNTRQIKMMVNASKNLTLMYVTTKRESDAKCRDEMIKYVSNYEEVSHEVQHEFQLHANTSLQPMIENEGLIHY
jgi:hypothetical protein